MRSALESGRVVELSSRAFVAGCAVVAGALLVASRYVTLPVSLLAAEIFGTVIGLFVFGSFRYRIHKNALTYGMALVILATFFGIAGGWKFAAEGWEALWTFLRQHVLSWRGLNDLVHADTMLFILGLTFFVAVIAHTRVLESIVFFLLRRNRGSVLPTTIAVTAVVAFSSGILDGVSMIGLTIRTLVMIMFLARAPIASVRYTVMICTVVTTVCGMWLAYGEPPNLIMKANLKTPDGQSYLTDGFFLRYCLPCAVASYLVVAWNLRRRLSGARIDLSRLDILDANMGAVRFLQALRHGRVLTPIELLEDHEEELGEALSERIQSRVQRGETLGVALLLERVPPETRRRLLGEYVSEELAEPLDRHYLALEAGDEPAARRFEGAVNETLKALGARMRRAQRGGLVGLAVFAALLVAHAVEHRIPLFVSSFTGFLVSVLSIAKYPRMRRLALHEARKEFGEYYFLLPLFLSISLLTKTGFFEGLQDLLRGGIERFGHGFVAFAQFLGATFLSATLDNNVVADFGARALLNIEVPVLYLFSMAQIAGYATGGCWTHIGSAQSVVAFSFMRRDIDDNYTPVQWLREMTPVVLEVAAVLTVVIFVESGLLAVIG